MKVFDSFQRDAFQNMQCDFSSRRPLEIVWCGSKFATLIGELSIPFMDRKSIFFSVNIACTAHILGWIANPSERRQYIVKKKTQCFTFQQSFSLQTANFFPASARMDGTLVVISLVDASITLIVGKANKVNLCLKILLFINKNL